ncbi:MAG: hypothetical protein IK083_02245 [Abditibacteriota bacterium]|nr:hypothetical protein [Abditibacteriota bacterium]
MERASLILTRYLLLIPVLLACIPLLGAEPDIHAPVTVRLNGERFYVVCERLSEKTGFEIAAGTRAEDWNVYDRRAFVSVENVPLDALLDTICRVFNFSYTVSGKTILFTQSEEQMKNEAELVLKEVAREAEEAATKRSKGVELIKKYASESPADARETCPYGYVLGTTSFGKALVALLDDPVLGPAVVRDNTSKYKYSDLPDASRSAVSELAKAYKELDPETDLKIFDSPEKLVVVINRPAPDENDTIDTETVLGRVSVMLSSDQQFGSGLTEGELADYATKTEINILYPDNRFTNVIANALLDIKAGKNRKDVADSMEAQLKFVANNVDTKKIDASRLVGEGFDKKIDLYSELKKKRVSFNEVLMIASVRAGVNMVADCFYRSAIDVSSRPETFSDVILRLCLNYDLDYDVSNNILTLKDRRWYMLRAGEIASDWLDYWEEMAEMQRGYSLDVLIEMARLTDLQIDYELSLSPQLNKQFNMGAANGKRQDLINTREVRNKRDVLRFLGSFSDEQKEEFLAAKKSPVPDQSGNGVGPQPMVLGKISAARLSDEQWALLEKAISGQNVNYQPQKRSSQVIYMTRSVGDYVDYEIHMQPDLTSETYTIIIRTNNIVKDDIYLDNKEK